MFAIFGKIGEIVRKAEVVLEIVKALYHLVRAVVKRLKQIFSKEGPNTYNAIENEDDSDTTNLPQ